MEKHAVKGIDTKTQVRFLAEAVVLTTGTFLAGKIHIGRVSQSGGRSGDAAAEGLATYLGKVFTIGRLKTGTPARISQDSIDYSDLEIQSSEDTAPAMSYMPQTGLLVPQRHCYITHTNERTHEIILKHVQDSPIFQQRGEIMGPRYCPSIEQKVDRFPEKTSHQIFIEPEGLNAKRFIKRDINKSAI